MRIYKQAVETPLWAFITAFCQFVLFLAIFLIGSYLSTLIEVDDSLTDDEVFVMKFEKYVVLATSLSTISLFVLSVFLIFALMMKNGKIVYIWLKAAIGTSTLVFLTMFGSGIFIAVKGKSYIGYSLIAVSLFCVLFMVHSGLLLYHIIIITFSNDRINLQDSGSMDDNFSIEPTSSIGDNSSI